MSVVEQKTKKAKLLFQFIYLKTIMHVAVSFKINTFFFFHAQHHHNFSNLKHHLLAEIKDSGSYLDFRRFSGLF